MAHSAGDSDLTYDEDSDRGDIPPSQSLAEQGNGQDCDPQHQGVAPKRCGGGRRFGKTVEEKDECDPAANDTYVSEPDPAGNSP
jgi:hypothetical protein